jgi:catechol 2,3-dioxygenase-like lactoylglutathione lyase family enzyme
VILSIDHLQMAIPPGGEDQARAFYGDLLGMTEAPRPEAIRARGGVWFRAGSVMLHLGVDEGFVPAFIAHPGLRVAGYDGVLARLRAGGATLAEAPPVPGVTRCFVLDPFGNRLELIDATGGSPG